MDHFIFSHTEPGGSYPAYMCLTKKEDGKLALSVRSNGEASPSQIVLPRDTLESLQEAIAKFLKANPI